MEQLKAMLKTMENDNVLLEEFGKLINAGNDAVIFSFVKEKGFNITEEELQSYKDFFNEANKNLQELDEEELEGIAGGSDAEINKPITSCLGKFVVDKVEFRNGEDRVRCNAWACWWFKETKPAWCNCYRTPACIDSWHSTKGHFKH